MSGTPRRPTQLTPTSPAWRSTYDKDFAAQKSSGPIVFTEEQQRKNTELLDRVTDLLPFEDAYKASDCDLIYRFLIGKHWNVAQAEKGLRDYVALRKKDHLDGLIGEQLHPTIGAVLCPCYRDGTPCPIYGLDRDGLPVLWLSPDATKLIAAMKQFTGEELLRGQMRAIELGRYVCRTRGVDRCTYVIDLGGITMSSVNKATLGFLKGVMNMLQVAYPEIMRRLLIFNTGWAVSAAWKVLRPLVDVRVQDKIRFESGAPTLAALQSYMAADQVHPAFGGTGTANVLDPLIEAEVRRLRGHGEDVLPSESTTPVRGPSTTIFENGSLFDVDPHALYSFYSATPGTGCPTPNESQHNISPTKVGQTTDRMVIGAPRAVTAWMANMGEDGDVKDALDMSLSVASSSNEYTVGGKSVSGSAAASRTLPAAAPAPRGGGRGDGSVPATPPHRSRRMSAAPSSSASSGAFLQEASDQLPPPPPPSQRAVAMSLTYGADGSITGYVGQQCAGSFRDGRLFAAPKESEAATPTSSSRASTPVAASAPRGSLASPRSQQPTGELLYEAGHPIHNFFIVCDVDRRARYLLRRSRLRTRLSVYHILGGAAVRTEKNNRHYVEGERAKLGVALASTDPTANAKGDWMLFGEDVTQRSAGQHLKQFFSKVRKSTASVADGIAGGGGSAADADKEPSWPASMFAAMSPSKRKMRAAAAQKQQRETDESVSAARSPRESTRRQSEGEVENAGGSQLLAENKGQTVYFYHLLAQTPLPDLFALTVAITLSWSGELEEMRGKTTSTKARRYLSGEESVIT